MQIAEIKDLCASGRDFLSEKNPSAALKAIDKAIAGCRASGNGQHVLMAVCQALRAEVLFDCAPNESGHAASMLKALSLCDSLIADDFENVAPVLLNAVRYYLATNKKNSALAAAKTLLAGCATYYGPDHPRWYQLQRWLDESGLPAPF